MKTILVALGGNAIKRADDKGTAAEQYENIVLTCKALVKIIKDGHRVVITHGNGPQAGNLLIQQEEGKSQVPDMPLDVVGAMTQGQIGYMFSQALGNLLRESGIEKSVVALVNQVEVSADDPDFDNPSKPVGPFYTKAEADTLKQEKANWIIKQVKPESVEKRFRRVVASPKPISNIEIDVIKNLVASGAVVIASGGGGVPVQRKGGKLEGLAAVIDKDLAGSKLAELLGVDEFLILTDVSHAKLNYGKPNERNIEGVSLSEMREFASTGDFLAGSMGPKVKACMEFVEKTGKRAIITDLDHAFEAVSEGFGTVINP